MKRKKREESAFDWPVIGIDLPYPEHVREALRLVAEETKRRKQAECGHENRDRRFAHRGLDRGLHADKGYETYCVDCEAVLGFEAEPPRYATPVLGFSYATEDIPTIRRVDGTPALIAPAEAEGALVAQFDWIYHQGNVNGFTDTMIQQLESLADQVDQARQRRYGRLRESYEGWGNDLSLPDRYHERQRPDGAQAARAHYQRGLALASGDAGRQAGHPR